MPVFQYKCDRCYSIFEYFFAPSLNFTVDCVSCGNREVSRQLETCFYPNKVFCPHDKDLEMDSLQHSLGGILKDSSQRCGGCGTDGAPGKCNSGGGGCGKGACGTCSCGKGG